MITDHPFIDTWRAEGYQYITLPKAMLEKMDSDEAMLYCILRDRVTMSVKNKWIDDQGRAYIVYTRQSAAKLCGWSLRKTIQVFQRLAEAGLIEEVDRTNDSGQTIAKRIFVRQWLDKSEYSYLPYEIEYPYITDKNVYSFTDAYYVVPKILIENELYEGISLRAKLLYVIALDRMHLSINYGQVDADGKVWCTMTGLDLEKILGCAHGAVTKSYAELEGCGLMVRVAKNSYGGACRVYLRDYLPISAPQSADFCTTNVPNSASQCADSCTANLPSFSPQSAVSCTQSITNKSSYNNPSSFSQHPLGGDPVVLRKEFFVNDIYQMFDSEEDIRTALNICDLCEDIMEYDIASGATVINGKPREDVLAMYRLIDRDTFLSMLRTVVPYWSTIRRPDRYLREALFSAYDCHNIRRKEWRP